MVHGRYNLIRYSKLTLNSFYKNTFFIFIQFFYNLYNGASGKSIYNSFFLNYYNLFFTFLVPFSIALFDRDVSKTYIFRFPRSYRIARAYFDPRFIYLHIGYGIVEAALVFFIIRYMVYYDISGYSGKLGGYSCISTIYSLVVFSVVIFRQYLMISYEVIYNKIAIGLSIVFNIIMVYKWNNISYSWIDEFLCDDDRNYRISICIRKYIWICWRENIWEYN